VSHIAGNLTKTRQKLELSEENLSIRSQHLARVVVVTNFTAHFAGALLTDKRNGLVTGAVTEEEANRQVFVEVVQPHVGADGHVPIAALVGLVQPMALMLGIPATAAEIRVQSWEATRILDAQAAALEARRATLAQEIRNRMEYDSDE
jgi:hypothetical protein